MRFKNNMHLDLNFYKNTSISKMSGCNSNDIAFELSLLHTLSGADYSKQVERIAKHKEFYPLDNESSIFICGGQKSPDFKNLLNAAHKLIERGYVVYILPNPKGIRTADFILESKGIYNVYDLKTITGKSSVKNRLCESIGQTNKVILHMNSKYDAVLLSTEIRHYFHICPSALEVIVLKGNKIIYIKRNMAFEKNFTPHFRKQYEK